MYKTYQIENLSYLGKQKFFLCSSRYSVLFPILFSHPRTAFCLSTVPFLSFLKAASSPNMNIHAYQLLSESYFLQIYSIFLITKLYLHTQFIFIWPKRTNSVQQVQELLYFPFTENMNFIYGISSLKRAFLLPTGPGIKPGLSPTFRDFFLESGLLGFF